MGNGKVIGYVLLVVGIILMILSFVADRIGIGGTPGFGYWQGLAGAAGGFAAAAGFYFVSGNRKLTGILLLVGGILLLILSLTADMIGFGAAGFGYNQIIGAVAGFIAAVVGFVLFSRK